MKLMFSSAEILERGRGLTFDDVLLVPRYSEVSSRRHPVLTAQITKKVQRPLPIIAANMDTITELEMAKAMGMAGGLGILHRFMDIPEQVAQVQALKKFFTEQKIACPVAASVGVKEEGKQRAAALVEAGVEILALDIAHGDSVMMLEQLRFVKEHFPQVEVIAGNVATAEGAKRLMDAGADAIKVGIGPGAMCTTRLIAGHGVPQLTAIALAASVAQVPLIADGGIRRSGDIVKALAAGASSVMLGSMLAGTLETPGEIKNGRKMYRGMASKKAQISWRGGVPEGMAAEGESTMVACKGSVQDVLKEVTGGIRSGMTYLGVEHLQQISGAAVFIEMSAAGLQESMPHGLSLG